SFPRAPHDDLCFIGDTIIATKRGPVAIRDVVVGDLSLTPDGWREVINCGFTGVRPVVSRGNLTGTENHPVFTLGSGYQPLYNISSSSNLIGNTLCGLLKTALLKSLNSMASPSAGWEESVDTIFRSRDRMKAVRPLRDCMSRFGSFIRAHQFRRGLKFTIRTATLSISILRIWIAYQWACIVASRNALIARSKRHSWI